ncbi:dephospho-CoA kinase [Kineococcus auxinigenes]|uniref:dephospho-CoA kinase n=1 Tax=unclassified Kineococcus TaxID=2621656 RepID=UPI003D7CB086
MLRVGLTGGIGAGKSTVARCFAALGAVVVDADVLAREVVAPGTAGWHAVVERFGPGVLTPDGELDRPALGRLVFTDPAARRDLNAVVHPLVAARREELVAAAPVDAVVVEDVPLLVETGMAPRFPLVVVVHADVTERVRRLVEDRGMSEGDARARVGAQAGDDERLAAADVVLDNPRRAAGSPDPLPAAVEDLWRDRLVPFERNLRERRVAAPRPRGGIRAQQQRVARLVARVAHAAGVGDRAVEPVDAAVLRGAPVEDVVELQLTVPSTADVARLEEVLAAAGFPRVVGEGDGALHGSADPGSPARLHVRVAGSPDRR